MKLVSVKSNMMSINGNAVTTFEVLICVVVSNGLNFIKLEYNKWTLVKDFQNFDVKGINFYSMSH